MLNEPVGYDEQRREDDRWTTSIGMWRGLRDGLFVGVIAAVLLAVVARYAPLVVLLVWLRAPLAFGLAYVLCRTIERAVGMSDVRCVILAIAITAAALLSNHVALALAVSFPLETMDSSLMFPLNLLAGQIAGVTSDMEGWYWMHPYVLIAVNVLPLVLGGGFVWALARR